MKILVLHTRLSGYFISCLRELKATPNTDLLVFAWPGQKDAPFDESLVNELGTVYSRDNFDVEEILRMAGEFHPDVVLVSGWADKGYVQVCRDLKRRGIPVVSGCDTQWKGSLRQHVAGLVAQWHVHKFIDVLWVSGERQRQLAARLGFVGEHCWDGYYTCDWNLFSTHYEQKQVSVDVAQGLRSNELDTANSKSFLFIGRYAQEKGLDTLAEAYQIYKSETSEPWRLVCAGRGEFRQILIDAGAEDRGFVQPDELPALMTEASVFVLPSRFEPWGVVLHEAGATGLPLIASDSCGAGVHLLRDRWNGRSFCNGDAKQLAECLSWFHEQSEERLQVLGQNSFQLSKQYTPESWVQTFFEGIRRFETN